MQKKLMYGLALAAIAGGAFVACGSGDVSGVTSEDKGNVFVYDSSYYVGRVETATNACASDAECAKKANNTVIEESSSSSEITEPGSSSAAVTSSASTEKSSSSAVINFSSASTSSSSTVVSSSSVEIQDDGTVNGTCAPVPATINKGESTTWTFTQVTPAGMAGVTAGTKAAYEWTMPKSTEGTANGTGLKTTTATYATESGTMTATLQVDGNTIQCSALQVNGAPITGCVCTPDVANPDVASGSATVTWKVSDCQTTGATITGYAWTDATGTGETATASFTEKGQTITPVVTVSNDDNTQEQFPCAAAKAVNSSTPDYEIDGTGITIPSGSCGTVTVAGNLRINTTGWQSTDCTIALTIEGNKQEKTFTNCNFSNELPTSVTVGAQACVEITGAESVKMVITSW